MKKKCNNKSMDNIHWISMIYKIPAGIVLSLCGLCLRMVYPKLRNSIEFVLAFWFREDFEFVFFY